MFCREQVAQLRDALDEIRAAGAELVVVGNGRPEHARDFREAQGVRFPLLVDPDLASYAAAGLRRGVLSTIGPRSLGHALRALRGGARQGVTRGDPWQLGGVLVIRPPGAVVYRHASREAGDHPPVHEILRALRAA
jgi:hypothetical protein